MTSNPENPLAGPAYSSRGQCDECGYQGTMTFEHLKSESYNDPGAGFYMLKSTCPACEQEENVLVTVEEYDVNLDLAQRGGMGD